MTRREAQLRQIVLECLPPYLKLHAVELGHADRNPARRLLPTVSVFVFEIGDPVPDLGPMLELDRRIAAFFGHNGYCLEVFDAPLPVAVPAPVSHNV